MIEDFGWTQPYAIEPAQAKAGFMAHFRHFRRRQQIVMMAAFGVLFATFAAAAIADHTNLLCYVLMMVCAAAVGVLWYNPRKQAQSIYEAFSINREDRYTARVQGGVFCVRTVGGEGESRVPLADAYVEQCDGFRIIADGKQVFYILPDTVKAAQTEPEAVTEVEK